MRGLVPFTTSMQVALGRCRARDRRSIAKAVAHGLTFRPFADTVKETMAFDQQQSDARKAELRAGLTAEREAALLAAWKARPGGD